LFLHISPNHELRWRPGAAGTGWTRQCPHSILFLFFYFAVAIGYLASARLVAEGGEGKSESVDRKMGLLALLLPTGL